MHLCTQSMRDFVYVTLVFDDGKWVEAHKMILAACNCLCLEKLAPTSTDLYERNSEEYFKAFDLRGNDLMLGFSSIQNLYKIFAGSAFCDKNAICNLFLIKMTYFMISIAKRCSYNSPTQRSQSQSQPIQPNPLIAPERKMDRQSKIKMQV